MKTMTLNKLYCICVSFRDHNANLNANCVDIQRRSPKRSSKGLHVGLLKRGFSVLSLNVYFESLEIKPKVIISSLINPKIHDHVG